MNDAQDQAGAAVTVTRDFNRLLVLEVIRLHAPVARFEIARRTGLTKAALTHIVAELLSLGYVRELGRRDRKRGQPARELDVNPDAAYSVGLHLDRNLLTAVLVDLKGAAREQLSLELSPPTPEEALRLLREGYASVIRRARVDPASLLGIGLVTVGPLDVKRGTVRSPPNFPGWHDVPLRQRLAEATGIRVFLDNNATAAAIGERWYGVGQHYRNFVYVYIGLGVGGGLVLDGRIHRGSGFNAGELGHVVVRPEGPPCACGARGCLEAVASLAALRRDLGSDYADPAALSSRLEARDPSFLRWLDEAASCFAQALGGIDNLLDVDAVLFGGRLPADVLGHLIGGVAERIDAYRMRHRPHYAVLVAGRVGDDTAALGAATLPVYETFAVEPGVSLRRRPAEVAHQKDAEPQVRT